MKKLLLPLLISLTITAVGQYKKPKGNGLYDYGKKKIDKGWYFGIGANYMAAYNNYTTTLADSLDPNTIYNYTASPKGRVGALAELGMFRMTDQKLLNYADFGVSWKWFRGGEDYLSETTYKNALISSLAAEGTYSDHLFSAHFNIGFRYDANDKLFYVNGVGINADYHFSKSRTPTFQIPSNTDYNTGADDFLAELHYFFGIGLKTYGRLMVMPIIETPILALFPLNHIKSTHHYFNTRARPILLKVRFMLLKKDAKSCPKVFNPEGIDTNGGLK